MASSREWLSAMRPRTLPAAVVPVAVGTAVASQAGAIVAWRALLALVVSLAIQIGTNFANDYSDGVRGTDEQRVGPTRLVASKRASPRQVLAAAIGAFAIAAVAGLVVALATSPWLLLVGAASIAAGWLYTGGPRPYGYAGYGELFVFVFFGLVAVVGSAYVASGKLIGLAFWAAIPVGLLAVALLVVNNLRDIPSDTTHNKKTLAVLLGEQRTRHFYLACLVFAFVSAALMAIVRPFALLVIVAMVFSIGPIRSVINGAAGRELVPVLGMTGRLQLFFGAALAIGIAL